MAESAMSYNEPQSAGAVLMVRPARFAFNPQTAPSNPFQHRPEAEVRSGEQIDLQRLALREFDALTDTLRGAGITVIVGEDTAAPAKPDALYPNNWVSFHRDGTVVLYPMLAPNRRSERREELIHQVAEIGGFRVTRTVDLSYRENQGKYLEGTGSLVLDRVRRVAYANLSPRTDLDVLGEFAQQLDYELVTFEAFDPSGGAVYHTNVVMAIGTAFAVVCGSAISNVVSREAVFSMLHSSGREIVDIRPTQMLAFAGNLLELCMHEQNVIALSTTAWQSLDVPQRHVLEKCGRVLTADIPVIERYGGGGVRCMLAEIHLPPRLRHS
jgi:hypothetical protein